MSWSDAADRVLADVYARLPKDASVDEEQEAVFAAYPFGPRKYTPYKIWLHRVKCWRAARAAGLSGPFGSAGPPRKAKDSETLRLL